MAGEDLSYRLRRPRRRGKTLLVAKRKTLLVAKRKTLLVAKHLRPTGMSRHSPKRGR